MKSKSLIVIAVWGMLAVVAAGCKTSAQSPATINQFAQTGPSPPPSVASDNSQAQTTPNQEKSQSDNKVRYESEPTNYTANPESPPPQPSSRGLTREVMKNVNFHADDLVAYDIRIIRGSLLRRYKNKPPIFDDKRSFILNIDSAVIGLHMDTLANLMNSYVFAYPGAPLKNFHFSVEGNQLKATGTVHKIADLPFEVKGTLSATPDGKIRVHPTSVKAGGLPVKGFMHLFGVELDEVIKARQARGLSIDDNDLILDPERMGPPPMIRGKVAAVQIVGDEVIMIFGGNKNLSEAQVAQLANSRSSGNYVLYRGGMLRFGKLTMTNADLKIVDANPRDPFDFSIDHYNQQLVAGYAKSTPRYGLVAHVPDFYKVQKNAATEIGKTNSKRAHGSGKSNSGGIRLKPPIESKITPQNQPLAQKPKKKGFFARLLHPGPARR